MSEVEQFEKRVNSLPPEDLAKFRAWFIEFDARVWDEQRAGEPGRAARKPTVRRLLPAALAGQLPVLSHLAEGCPLA